VAPAVSDTKAGNEPQVVATDPCPAKLAKTRKPYCSDVLRDGGKGPLMVVLPAGRFRMGSEREASEQPVREISIDRPFAISAYEVSVAEYRRFCKASGRHCVFTWKREKDPAVNVSWKDARSFTNWLSAATGMNYRLPTEAEWEYAARGRTTGDYPFGDGSKVLPSDARFDAASPLPVDDRSVNTNGFRLRHIVGNVREWVGDAWFDDYQSMPRDGRARTSSATSMRVVRGGSFADSDDRLRSSAREKLSADTRDNRTGFRLVREINN
jgi:formylglycine-generating enzyme required for sulfatase activity